MTATIDPRDLAKLEAKLDPAVLLADLAPWLEDLALRAEGEIKDRTPVRTGHLRRSIVSDLSEAKSAEPSTRVWTDVEYANPVESHAAMFADGGAAAIAAAGQMTAALIATIEKRWET